MKIERKRMDKINDFCLPFRSPKDPKSKPPRGRENKLNIILDSVDATIYIKDCNYP